MFKLANIGHYVKYLAISPSLGYNTLERRITTRKTDSWKYEQKELF